MSNTSYNQAQQEIETLREHMTDLNDKLHSCQNTSEIWRLCFENISDYVAFMDEDGNIQQVNSAWTQLTSKSKEELVGRSYNEIFYRSPNSKEQSVQIQAMNSGETVKDVIHSDVFSRDFEITAIPVNNPDGSFKGTIFYAKDVTKQKAAELALDNSEQRFRELFNLSLSAIFVIFEGKYFYANPQGAKMLGYELPQELIGVDVVCTIAPKDREKISGMLTTAKDGISNSPITVRMLKKDSSEVYVESTSTAVELDGEHAILITALDVTEKITAQKIMASVVDNTENETYKIALEKNQAELRSILDTIPNYAILLELDGTVVECNEAMANRFGKTREELIGLNAHDFLNDKIDNERWFVVDQAITEKRPIQFITERSGKTIEDSIVPIFSSEGEVYRLAIYGQDITERIQGQKQIAVEKNRSQQYLDIAGTMFIALGSEGKITLANRRACEILGVHDKSVIGEDWFEHFIPEDERTQVRNVFENLMAGNLDEYEFKEYMVKTVEGGKRLIAWQNSIMRDGEGNIIGTLSSGEDITEQRKAQEEYKIIIENSLQGYAIFLDNRIVFANEALSSISGYTIEALCSLTPDQVSDIFHPEDREKIFNNLIRLTNGEVNTSTNEYKIIQKNGGIRWVETIASRTEYQLKPAVQITYLDITDRKTDEETQKSERDHLLKLFDAIPAYVYLQGRDYKIKYANLEFKKLFGEPGNRPCYEIMHGRSEACEDCPTFDVFDMQETIRWKRMDEKNGRTYLVYDAYLPELNGESYVLEIGIDITEHKKTETKPFES